MRRLGLVLATLLAIAAGVASASALTAGTATDTPGGAAAVQPDGSGASLPVVVADPEGGTAWGVRVYRSQAGLTCPEAGRTKDGIFGQVDGHGDFHSLELEAAGSCADLAKAPMALAVNHYPAAGELPARAVVFGVANASIAGLQLSTASGVRDLSLRSGAFIAVLRDEALRGATLDAKLGDGSMKSYALAPAAVPADGPEDPATQ